MDFQGCFSSASSCGQTQNSPPLPAPSPPPYGPTTRAFFPAPSSLPDDHISFSCPLPRSPSSSCVHYRSRSDALTEDYYDGNKDGKNDDVFLISSKEASLERLRRWRQATLALNAVRRFRYTTDLGREAELDMRKQEAIKRLRAGTTAIRAIQRFKAAAGLSNNEVKEEDEEEDAAQGVSPPPDGFGVSAATLTSMMKNQDREILGRLGGPTGVAKSLHSDLENGLSSRPEEMLTRTEAFGANAFPRKPSKSLLVFFWEAFQDPTLAILMVCAALSLGFGMRSHGPKEGWYDGASIAFAVILVVFITAISDFNQFQQFKELGKEKQNIQLRVLREGRRPKISIYELVVGDVVPIHTGDQVPADGLLIHGHQLSVDESSITGESEHVIIDRKHPFLLSGSKVADGYGLMLVVSVGTSTEWGSIMSSISSDVGEETPLQVRLNGVATFIGKMGLAVAVSVFVVLMSFYFTGHRTGSDGSKFKAGHTKASAVLNSVVDIFSIAVTIIVVAVPEGLPLAVTLTLAYSMKKMMADRALVRRLSSCETMGSATTICSDKTGTLTLNEMTVVKACVGGEIGELMNNVQSLHVKTLLLEGIAYNTSGSVFLPVESGGEMEIIGSPTEKAILRWGLKSGMNYEGLKSAGVILHVESFNSESKRAGVAVKAKESGRIYVHWKGAAEIILGLCDKSFTADGSMVVMGEERRAELLNVIEGMAASSLRCVAFACKEVTETVELNGEASAEAWRMPESELTLLAIVGIKDPCRPEVREAVRRCQAAGVEVRMVTGDNLLTAKAIAAECGILQDGFYAIEGRDFRALTPEERKRQVSKICILARSSPTDKLLLVKTLKEIGHVVGVTGDGTNDAPALHAADVGLSMGIQGTEVAKESSDIIILDDNFSSVVKVVCWGRSVYANIQKFIQFQLTVNVAALSINFVAAISSGSVPLTTVQLLWVNLIMDTLGALALATEPPNEDLMRRRPVGRRDPLITKLMWLHILSQAGYQITILLTLQFIGKPLLGLSGPSAEAVKNTMIFNSFVFCQIFNEVNARRPSKLNIFEGVFKNRLFVGIVASTAVAQVLIVEFLEKFASTTKLNGQQWLICLGIAFISWPIAFVVKFLPIQRLNNIVNMRTC